MVYWMSNKPEQPKQAKTGQNGPALRAVEAVKGLDPMRYGTLLPPHTLIRMSRGEIHLDPVKKLVYWVSNKPE